MEGCDTLPIVGIILAGLIIRKIGVSLQRLRLRKGFKLGCVVHSPLPKDAENDR